MLFKNRSSSTKITAEMPSNVRPWIEQSLRILFYTKRKFCICCHQAGISSLKVCIRTLIMPLFCSYLDPSLHVMIRKMSYMSSHENIKQAWGNPRKAVSLKISITVFLFIGFLIIMVNTFSNGLLLFSRCIGWAKFVLHSFCQWSV